MRIDPAKPRWQDRDRLIISKAHCCETVYSALALRGFFGLHELTSYGKINATLQAHVNRKAKGVDFSGGSLGQGLSFALGSALAARIESPKDSTGRVLPRFRVFCILGDGECDQGQVWEAAMAAAHYEVDNIIAIVDNNKYQRALPVADTMNLEPFADKWRAFNWDVHEINGHDFTEILTELNKANQVNGKPHVIIAHTVKCKGVPSFMNKNLHYCTLTDDMYEEAIKALK
jgi:transketolase